MDVDNVTSSVVPAEMRELERWLCWRLVEAPPAAWASNKRPKPRKVPFSPRTGDAADPTDSKLMTSYDEAETAREQNGYSGVGFALGDADIVGIDLDDCRDPSTGAIAPWARYVVDWADSYTEVSPSGTGVKIFLKAAVDLSWNRLGANIEIYNRDRYFTVTRDALNGSELRDHTRDIGKFLQELKDDFELIERATRPGSGDEFAALFGGDISAYDSHSEADLALTDRLAVLAGGDEEHIDRLFRQSGLYREKWDEPRGRGTYGSVTVAKAAQWYRTLPANSGLVDNLTQDEIDELLAYNMTDLGMTDRVRFFFHDRLRYIYERKMWFAFSGTRWEPDFSGHAWQAATATAAACRQLAAGLSDQQRAATLSSFFMAYENSRRTEGLLKMMQNAPPFALTIDAFDQDVWACGTPQGILDLRTGALRPADPLDYLTKTLGTEYDPDAACPLWEKTLYEILEGRRDMIDFLQEMAGYSLTGKTDQQLLLMMVGKGANGKSAILNTLASLMGDYAGHANFSAFDGDANYKMTEDVARLAGTRMVSIVETDEGRRFSESRVKSLTGRDPISAAYKYGHIFTYMPQFTLWFAFNHVPYFNGSDYAIKRRMCIIDFNRTFSREEQKFSLEDDLREELPGILNWALRGLHRYLDRGGQIYVPPSVSKNVEDAAVRNDKVFAWIDDATVRREDGDEAFVDAVTTDLYDHYGEWSKRRGEKPLTYNSWLQRLYSHGFTSYRKSLMVSGRQRKERYIDGLALAEAVSTFTTMTR